MVELIIVFPVINGIKYVAETIAFIFWFIYLLHDAFKRRAYYKSLLERIQQPNDRYSEEEMYVAKTDYVKIIFLFWINIIEWVSSTLVMIEFTYICVEEDAFYFCKTFTHTSMPNNSTIPEEVNFKDNFISLWATGYLKPYIFSRMLLLGNNLFLFNLIMVACLCNYLASRYARLSWIKYNKIPYIITISIIFMLIAEICSLFCFLNFFVRCVHFIVLAIVLIFGIKQSRKLRMVINWTVVDLEVSKNNPNLIVKFKQMNRRLRNLLAIFWFGCICILISIFTANIRVGVHLVLQIMSEKNHDYFCPNTKIYIPSYIQTSFSVVEDISCVLGSIVISAPYILTAFVAMPVLIYLRIRGRTGYKTHFPNPLRTALI